MTPTSENKYLVLNDGFVVVDKISDTESELVELVRRVYETDSEKNRAHRRGPDLLKFMWNNGHTSPFGFITLRFFIKAPLFVARQWFRHRTGLPLEMGEDRFVVDTDTNASRYHQMLEYSGRYGQYTHSFYLPAEDRLVSQPISTLQTVQGVVPSAESIRESMREEQGALGENYQGYLDVGLSREVARINMPLSQFVTFEYQQDLGNLFHWLAMRRHPAAQWEIREYAKVIEDVVHRHFPWTYDAWLDQIEGVHLSREEIEQLRVHLDGEVLEPKLFKKLVGEDAY